MRIGSHRLRLTTAALAMVALLGLLPTAGFAAQGAEGGRHERDDAEEHVASCSAPAAPETARCHSEARVDAKARQSRPQPPGPNTAPPVASPNALGNSGAYDPNYLRAAYNLGSLATSAGVGQTVAIVDAYDDPNAEADMNRYRSFFSLGACTTANGCFRKLNQNGNRGPYPPRNAGWAQEISLDLDMVSAICPKCNIVLVEARSATFSDLGTAVNTAARLNPAAISNSYGANEFNGETAYEPYYSHPHVMVVASSGDAGYGVQFPAASRYVTAVGGTSLIQNSWGTGRDGSESAWTGAGSGCSAYVPKPGWQTDAGCANRTVADVSAVADPGTGVWVYDTYQSGGQWFIFGGTSVAAPIVASVYALAGNTFGLNAGSASYGQSRDPLNDVTSGSNGVCSVSYLCDGVPGYDGPTGNGTPNGMGGF